MTVAFRSGAAAMIAKRTPLPLSLGAALALGALLRFTRVGDFHNTYYTATVASMLDGPRNLLFASFDPGGAVMVDKPPFSFWVEAIPAGLFGVNAWSVTISQALLGTLAIAVLYAAIRPHFGGLAAAGAALTLAVIPASVIIDSRNEPDSLLSFLLVVAAFAVGRAATGGRWRWLLAFAVLMGVAFNTKMLVAFVPLPAFLFYYLLATKLPWRALVVRAGAAVAVIVLVSASWVTLVALTPPDQRPYVGSTQDNSILTLVFEYNGLRRFTSFIGPRPQQVPEAASSPASAPQRTPGTALPGPRPPITTDVQDEGLLGLLHDPLAGQLGWLLPVALIALMAAAVPLLTEGVLANPRTIFALCRETPAAGRTVLWGGWLVCATLAFGLANATTTHPYYLVGLAVPAAAVLGIALGTVWGGLRQAGDHRQGTWLLMIALAGAALYQVQGARDSVGDWAVAAVLVMLAPALLVLSVAARRGLTATPLAAGALVAGCLTLLVIPLGSSVSVAGRVAGRGAGASAAAPPGGTVDPQREAVEAISAFIERRGDAGSKFAIATVSAREAAPFIIAGVPALAIGSFSGRDPVFTLDSFRQMAELGELRYFLMPDLRRQGGRSSQPAILGDVADRWEDVSLPAGLPRRSLYRYSDR